MKRPVVLLSGLVFSAFLTGCTSSPSLEDQVSLIEYENCLETQRKVWEAQSKFYGEETLRRYVGELDQDRTLSEWFIERCKKNRP
jgi:hypothetical protein